MRQCHAQGVAYVRREPEMTAPYQDFHRHLSSFGLLWKEGDDGGHLPRHVTQELQEFLTCGILAQMNCDACHQRHLVALSCKGRGFCPSCLGRRMNEGAANLVDHVLPEKVPIRQWVLTLPYPLRYPLAFDARHLSQVLRLNPHALRSGLKHMELVAWFKSEHKIGHGHANAIVSYLRSQTEG